MATGKPSGIEGFLGGPVGAIATAGVGGIFSFLGAKKQASAIEKGYQSQERSANLAAQLTSQSAQQQLDYVKQKDEQDRRDFYNTQRANYEQQTARDMYDYGKYATRESNLGPYRGAGAGAQNLLARGLGVTPVEQAPTPMYTPPPMPAYLGGDQGGPAGAPGQDYQALFSGLTQGKAPTPQNLTALTPELAKAGIKPLTNASGVAGKIQLPNGQIVDVIQGAGSGGQAWQWLAGGGGGGAQAPRAPQTAYNMYAPPTAGTQPQARYSPSTPALTMPNPYTMYAPRG